MTLQQQVCKYILDKGQADRIVCDALCSRVRQDDCPIKEQLPKEEVFAEDSREPIHPDHPDNR